MTVTVHPIRPEPAILAVPVTTFLAGRLILNCRGEAVRVLRHPDHVSIETHVLTDRIVPELGRAGFVADLELGQSEAIALICQLADAYGLAVMIQEGK